MKGRKNIGVGVLKYGWDIVHLPMVNTTCHGGFSWREMYEIIEMYSLHHCADLHRFKGIMSPVDYFL